MEVLVPEALAGETEVDLAAVPEALVEETGTALAEETEAPLVWAAVAVDLVDL